MKNVDDNRVLLLGGPGKRGHRMLAESAGALKAEAVPANLVRLLTELFSTIVDDRNELLSDAVRQALGRNPRNFGEYARTAAASEARGDRR